MTNPGTGGAVSTTTPTVNYAVLRLTNAQYLNTLNDLFAGMTLGQLALPNENVVDNFSNAATGQTPTSLLVEDYQDAAEAIATVVAANSKTVAGCQPKTTADEDTCAMTFISTFGKSAYRRPLTTDEQTRLFTFYKADRVADDFPTSIGAVVQVIVQSPSFLYRLEAGKTTSTGNLVPLTSYEVAVRLSYFLTNTMPDATLRAAADQNALTDPSQVETQARRLLADPRARATVALFNYQWLRLSKLENLDKDAKTFPTFTSDLGQALSDSTIKYVDHEFWDNGTLTALLTDSHAYVNNLLAPLYGMAAPGSATLALVSVDPTQRAGILTQVGMLSGLAGAVDDSPVQRGLQILEGFLCRPPPPPPAGVNTTPPAFDPSAPSTVRQRLTSQHAVGSCAGCHTVMDAFGFTFENYDGLGRWRTQDNGLPVDSTAQISTGLDIDGAYSGAIPLVQKLAQSQDVAQCVSYQWLRYALGLDSTQVNLPAAQSLSTVFTSAGGSFGELLVAITKSDYFRSLKVSN